MAQPNLKNIQIRDLMSALKKAAEDKMQIIFVIISGRGNDYAQVKNILITLTLIYTPNNEK